MHDDRMRSPEKAKSLPKIKTAADEKRPALAVLHRSLSTAVVNDFPEASQAVSTMVQHFARKKQRFDIETAKLKDVIREKATDLEEQACKVAALEQEVRQN